jgi:hydrogenase maturation protease
MGNDLLRDEGIGVHTIRRLQEIPDLGPVKLVDGGCRPDAIEEIRGIPRLIIVDAIRAGGEVGAIYRLSPEQVEVKKPASVHEMTVIDMLWSLSLLGEAPKVTIIGVEPKDIEWDLELSPELAERLPKVVEVVLEEIRQSLSAEAFS